MNLFRGAGPQTQKLNFVFKERQRVRGRERPGSSENQAKRKSACYSVSSTSLQLYLRSLQVHEENAKTSHAPAGPSQLAKALVTY